MLETAITETDSTLGVKELPYGGVSNVPWYVEHVEALPEFTLAVRFVDGTAGTVEMKELIFSAEAGVFETLRDEVLFSDVSVVHGDVIWANGLDIAPDAMYDEFRVHDGVWVLR